MKWRIGDKTVDILPPVKRYMNAIERRLRADRATRVRIMTELAGDFESRREAGQSDEAIMAELGAPEEVAAQFNSAFGVSGRPSRWRWIFAALAAVVLAVSLVPVLAGQFAAESAASLGVIGGADGPTAIYVTAAPGQTLLRVFPWLLGCLAGFLLPTWRDPHARDGYALSLGLCLPGMLRFLMVLWMGSLLSYGMGTLTLQTLPYLLWALLANFFLDGTWLCIAVFCRALWVRRRNRKAAGQNEEKK